MSSCSSNIEDYQIGKLIGKGSSGKVYSATNLKSGEIVAIKVIEKNNRQFENKSDVEAKILRIRREVEIHHRLRHSNIVELINFFEDSNFVYLIMQFCEFGDLSYFLKTNHPLEKDLIRSLFRQIINGILYLHSNGIMHRDISMSNILISKDSLGNILCKLSDFGIATVVRNKNQHNAAFPMTNPVDSFKQTLCGTPDFIAPEVVMHSPYDLSRDIWSLGCILYSMYVGKSPFHAQNIHESMRLAILKDLELDNSLFPPQVSQLLQLMLNKNPKERPSIQQLLSHPFVELPQNENCRNLCNSDSGLISTLNCKASSQKIPNLEGLNFDNDTQFRNRRNILGESNKVNIATHFTADSLPITTTFIGEKTKHHFSKVSNSFQAQTKIEKLSPIKSFNLPEFSYKSKNINLNVTKNFWVKLLTRRGETLDISPDGHIIYQTISQKRTVGTNNCSKASSKLLSYYQMPDDMVRKYNYAYKFVKHLKSKVPKITYYCNSSCREILLMFNGDIEATIGNISAKSECSSSTLKFYNISSGELIFSLDEKNRELLQGDFHRLSGLPTPLQPVFKIFEEYRQKLLELNESIANILSARDYPPLTIGKRTPTDFSTHQPSIQSDHFGSEKWGMENLFSNNTFNSKFSLHRSKIFDNPKLCKADPDNQSESDQIRQRNQLLSTFVAFKYLSNVGWISLEKSRVCVNFEADNSLIIITERSTDSLRSRDEKIQDMCCWDNRGNLLALDSPEVQNRLRQLPYLIRKYQEDFGT